jgi:hypothetical protein
MVGGGTLTVLLLQRQGLEGMQMSPQHIICCQY